MRLRSLIPSMYQRRLILLVAGMGLLGLAPFAQMTRLTVEQGKSMRTEAEKRLVNQEWLETVRGPILDCKGRILAQDRPAFEIAVDYDVITGEWADEQARRKARQAVTARGGRWSALSPDQRDADTQKYLPEFKAHLDHMWDTMCRLSGVSREELDQRKTDVREQVEILYTEVNERQREERQRELNDAIDPLDDEPPVEVKTADVQRPVKEQQEAHVLLRDVPDAVGFALEQMRGQTEIVDGRKVPLMPGLQVHDSRRREYPLDTVEVPISTERLPPPLRQEGNGGLLHIRVEGVATHVLGWMRSRLVKEDLERRPMHKPDGSLDLGHYRPGDTVGQGGIEQAAEDELRGLRGLKITHLDTGKVDTTPPVHGKPVQLTIDVMLQARLQALFSPSVGLAVVQPWNKAHTPGDEDEDEEEAKPHPLPLGTVLNGAIVVLDIQSGDILAMVSSPSFSHKQLETDPTPIFQDKYSLAYVNRAIDRGYPPGSIVKPLMLNAAIAEKKYTPTERIACTGHYFPDKPNQFRCWIYKENHTTHSIQFGHDLNGSDAIKASCNIFFFEMGHRLGLTDLHDWYTKFGVGKDAQPWNLFGSPEEVNAIPTGRALLGEYPGSVPEGGKPNLSESLLMGIGQGPLLWTPLHAADAYATIARGGIKLTPRLRADAPQTRTDLHLDPRGIAQAMDGLWRCANEYQGTTHTAAYPMADGQIVRQQVFNVPGINIWAKSGTADAPPFVADLNANTPRETFDGDHAWCVCLAGVDKTPKYAIAVVVDYGGSGGKVAGPVANQVVNALVSEGYLPNLRPPGPSDGEEPTNGAD